MTQQNTQHAEAGGNCGKSCACHLHQINRREFMAITAATTLTGIFGSLPVMAGPFAAEAETLIPADKKLRPEWVESLFARGTPTVYSKARGELNFIGMPVGGLCCGTVYLGGDGRLWNWDIFNQAHQGAVLGNVGAKNGSNYIHPNRENTPFEQGFALKIGDTVRRLDADGWEDVTFQGQYPVGRVNYSDPASPVSALLTAYSPFIPLNADDSGLPVVLCEITLQNTGSTPVDAEIGGWMQNAARRYSEGFVPGERVNTLRSLAGAMALDCRFSSAPAPVQARPDITVEDFQHAGYGLWKAEGTAFGTGPILRKDVPAYQGDLGGVGDRVVNSHATAPGKSVSEKDAQGGTLTSPPFTVARNLLSFYIGGGSNIETVGLAVIVDGKVVRRATGKGANHMEKAALSLAEFTGKQATIQIYDKAGAGAWTNIGVSEIVQTDLNPTHDASREGRDDGTMSLALLGGGNGKADVTPETLFSAPAAESARSADPAPLIGGLSQSLHLLPGKPQTVVFAVAWHFPHAGEPVADAASGNHYAKRFADAAEVARYVIQEYPRLSRDTMLWNKTWYDSTLPHWFLDRAFANTSTLATATAHRYVTGRFWGWEGVGCCAGTCTHVYHYGQAIGRIFPEIERDMRERVDFGAAFYPDTGMIGYRGEKTGPAVDGQCGRILGVLREHQMSADDAFLRRLWPNVQKALEWVSGHDTDGDGLLEGAQQNTLDAAWFGKIPWISSLYAAALGACQAMALDMGNTNLAAQYGSKLAQTRQAIEAKLFNGEYFIQLTEAGHEHSLGVYQTSHIDQVMGQSWAWQVGLDRILDQEKTVSALKALYRYNFAPDVGPYRAEHKAGRVYALAGEAGLIMATNPKGLPDPFGAVGWQTSYFNECMSGFEHQAASHMIAEGMVLEGMAVTRAVHDRYHAAKRNPYNEIECSDHYARAMASYGSFITLCGFEYHGPKGHIGFAPRLTPERFRTPFTVAEGWGTFAQEAADTGMDAHVALKHGQLRLSTLDLSPPPGVSAAKMTVTLADKPLAATHTVESDGRVRVALSQPVTVVAGQTLSAHLGPA